MQSLQHFADPATTLHYLTAEFLNYLETEYERITLDKHESQHYTKHDRTTLQRKIHDVKLLVPLIHALPSLQQMLKEFIEDITSVGLEDTRQDWPDLADTCSRATALLTSLPPAVQIGRRRHPSNKPTSQTLARKEYRVEWVIELHADSPEAAARQALDIQRTPTSLATVFDVKAFDSPDDSQRIDLTERDEAHQTTGTNSSEYPTDEQYREAAKRVHGEEGEVEIDNTATVSRGDDAGAYVQAWVWVPLDQISGHQGVRCAQCEAVITEEADGHSTFCGSMHTDCIETHGTTCEVCRKEFC